MITGFMSLGESAKGQKMIRNMVVMLLLASAACFAQGFESRVYGGLTLPIGVEAGFIGETDLPGVETLKLFTKGSLVWAPVLGDDTFVKSVLIGGLQPGLRWNPAKSIVRLSAALSFNPVSPLPLDGIDFGFGSSLGVAVRAKDLEIGLYTTRVSGNKIHISKLGWLTITVSRAFPVVTDEAEAEPGDGG